MAKRQQAGQLNLAFHNLGSICGWAGILSKRPALETLRISPLFVKASLEGSLWPGPGKGSSALAPYQL